MRRRVGSAGAILLLAVVASPLAAQEPDSTRVRDTTAVRQDSLPADSALVADSALLARPPRDRCVLRWEPLAPDTEGLSLREGGEAHVTYVSGRMLWTCGTATMEADSAVKYDRARRVDLIGNVVYRDTLRTLHSRLLTYFELQDLVIATREVRLERNGDGSTLDGPRIEFLRAVSGIDELTIATGRPHMRLYPEGEDRSNPFEIDADRTVFAGEEEARAYGSVVITRDDLDAAADSAYLRRTDETGVLWGSPWVDAQDVRLSGDTIRFASEDDDLREVHSVGNAHAVGESFEVRSAMIDVALADREVEAVWAHGEGAGEAVSGAHHVYGDSLRFVMFAGAIDTMYAVGEALAIQAEGPLVEARLDPPGADSTHAAAGDSAVAPVTPDTSMAAAGEPAAAPIAADPARSVGGDTTVVAVTDTPGAAGRDTVATPPDSAAAGAPDSSTLAAIRPDSAMAPHDSATAARDSAGVRAAAGPGGGVDVPRPGVDARSNWVRGDTLIAVFERDSLAARDSLPAPALPAGDSLAAVAGDSLPPPAAADTASEPRMKRLTAIGNARSFYRQVRDSSRTNEPSRNYMLGKRIDVLFSGGEPRTVKGTEAIGIYLEPEEGAGPPAGRVPAPPVVPADSGAVRDTLGVVSEPPPDSLAARPDSLGAGRDSIPPPDSVSVAGRPVARSSAVTREPAGEGEGPRRERRRLPDSAARDAERSRIHRPRGGP